MTDNILKPCPFCGGKAAYAKKYAYCTKCAASCGYSDEDLEMIAAAWNTRTLTSTVTEKYEEGRQFGIKQCVDSLKMRACNNWHTDPEKDKLRWHNNDVMEDLATDLLEPAPEHFYTWTSLQKKNDEIAAMKAKLKSLNNTNASLSEQLSGSMRLVRAMEAKLEELQARINELQKEKYCARCHSDFYP